jgi:small subunit ribosomal protein S6
MRPYETMIIFDPDLEEQVIQDVVGRALEVVRANGGTPGQVDRWGKRTFAYELRRRREGYYVVAEFSADPKASAELDRFLTLADEVLRHKIIRLPDNVVGRSRPRPRAGRTGATAGAVSATAGASDGADAAG